MHVIPLFHILSRYILIRYPFVPSPDRISALTTDEENHLLLGMSSGLSFITS